MNKHGILLMVVGVLVSIAPGHALAAPHGHARGADKPSLYVFRYEHKYKTDARTQIDKIGLYRKLGRGFEVALFQEFLSQPNRDGSAGPIWDHLDLYKSRLDISYSHKLGSRVTLKPRFRVDYSDSKTEFKPRLAVKVQLTNHWFVEPGYERKISHYHHGSKTRHANEYALAVEYKWNTFSLKYTRKELRADLVIYNRDNNDYKNQISITHTTGSWQPYLDVRDVSRGSKVSGRQIDVRVGFKFKF